jgi:predicted O-methyltransferase YrrM
VGAWNSGRFKHLFEQVMNYHKLVELSQQSEIKYQIHSMGHALKMVEHANPVSITYKEFLFIKEFIVNHKLKCGYEVATAFGISALSAGLGFKETGGKLVTMDAYIEEKYDYDLGYIGKQETYQDADGYKSTQFLINQFDLKETIIPKIGWSPTDTKQVISEVFDLQSQKLDYVFIDAGHWNEALLMDVESIVDLLADKFVVFMHDWQVFSELCKNKISNMLKCSITAATSGGMPEGFNLVYATNLI